MKTKGAKVRIYKLNEGIFESLQYAGIGVPVGGVNPPRGIGIMVGETYQTPQKLCP